MVYSHHVLPNRTKKYFLTNFRKCKNNKVIVDVVLEFVYHSTCFNFEFKITKRNTIRIRMIIV